MKKIRKRKKILVNFTQKYIKFVGDSDAFIVKGLIAILIALYSDKKPDDFLIEGPAVHGVAGLINLLGIESPGLTASLAIGKYVSDLVTASSY